MSANRHPRLAVHNVSKTLSGTRVLDGICLDVRPGEVHVLLGEKGSGKSTLIGILAGIHPADSGEIFIDGRVVRIRGPQDARKLGISTIFQRSYLVPHLSIAENILLGREPVVRGLSFIIRKSKLIDQAQEVMAKLNLTIDPRKRVEDLSAGEQRLVEIAKAVNGDIRILAVDEPVSSLTTTEMLRFFERILELKKWGVGILYVSHRLEEAKAIGDVATVLRSGRSVESVELAKVDVRHLVGLMMGPQMDEEVDRVSEHHRLLVRALDVREEERRRIALDIHDGVAQYMAQALHQMQATERYVASDPVAAIERLETAETLLKQTITEMRKVMFSLHPADLERGELISTLDLYLTSFQRMCGVECRFQVLGNPCNLRQDVESTVFRIVQEALQNVQKHARARTVQIMLEFGVHTLHVSVVDDGDGFDRENVAPAVGHWGLVGMQERAKGIGARLEIQSASGQGTRVVLEVGLRRRGGQSRGKLISLVKTRESGLREAQLEALR